MAKSTKPDFNNLLSYFSKVINNSTFFTLGSSKSYISRLKSYNDANGNRTFDEIVKIIEDKGKSGDPLEKAMADFNSKVHSFPVGNKTIDSWRSAYKLFCETIIGRYNGNVWLSYVLSTKCSKAHFNEIIYELIAQCAIFASPDVVNKLIKKGNPYACWYDNPFYIRDQKNKSKPTIDCNGRPCTGDDNSKANQSIKRAILDSCHDINIAPIGSFVNYTACHIVQNSTDNIDYYTSIPNIILLPSALADLTDFLPGVQDILNYHAIVLYKLPYPKPELNPQLLKIYKNLNWRENY